MMNGVQELGRSIDQETKTLDKEDKDRKKKHQHTKGSFLLIGNLKIREINVSGAEEARISKKHFPKWDCAKGTWPRFKVEMEEAIAGVGKHLAWLCSNS